MLFLAQRQRCPSVVMAETIVAAYRLTGWEAQRLSCAE
jgi:hypothetical protein